MATLFDKQSARAVVGPANPFGLTDSRTLDSLRQVQLSQAFQDLRGSRTGTAYAAGVTGTILGDALRNLLVSKGLMKDPAADEASLVTSAQRKARLEIESRPAELKESGALGAQREYGLSLIQELTAAGLHNQADTVRQQLIALDVQDLELRKLEGSVESQAIGNINSRIDARINAATEEARISKANSDAVSSSVTANTALHTAGFERAGKEVDYLASVEKLQNDRSMRPFLVHKAESDSQIASIQASIGGTVPQLVVLQNQRDNLLRHIADNPGKDHTYTKSTIEEINQKIQQTSLGIQRNVDNWSPTTQVRTDVQSGLIDMATFQAQANSILSHIENTTSDAFGADADLRTATAGYMNKVLTFAGAPASVADSVSDGIANPNILMARSEARQLHTDLSRWLAGTRGANQSTMKMADGLLQVLDVPSVDRRQATIALMKFSKWIVDQQTIGLQVLDQNIQAITPANEMSIQQQYDAYMRGQ